MDTTQAPHTSTATAAGRRLIRDPMLGLTAVNRLLLAGIGATPVSLVGLSTFGFLSLQELAVAVLVPALCVLAVLVIVNDAALRLTIRAVGIGVVATLVYDLLRWMFLLSGWMDRDPIPHIGVGLNLTPGWLFGYLWRFLGNGGGLAMVFFASGARGTRAGIAWGLFVCAGLLAVLALSPNGEAVLFPLGPATYAVAIVGHIIYGGVLGYLSKRW